MSRTWTPEQREAIETSGCSLLVSAAAGSGKTSVLAERCVHLICDARHRVHVSQLLVVTFTEAAAGEMRSRIEQALRARARLSAHRNDAHIQKQLALLDHASISTLHGFCARILRQHFHRAGLDPSFRILDGDEAALMRLEVVRNLFMERYDSEHHESFRAFIDAFGEGRDDALMDRVLETYELLRSLADPQRWMSQAISRISLAIEQPLEQSDLGREYLQTVRERLADAQRDCAAAAGKLAAMGGLEGYARYAGDLLAEAERWSAVLARQGYDTLVQAVAEAQFAKLPATSSRIPGKELAQSIVEAARKQLKEGPLSQCLRFTGAQWKEGLESILPHAKVFLDLVEEFGRRYRAEKDATRVLDFSDLERFALRLLQDGKNAGNPSPVARSFHRTFQHVLVDEYQDINEVQDAILNLVSRECVSETATANLFCVGDVKQSIYRFRLAEPARFLDRMERFRSKNAPGKVIDLQANFRSRKPLLDVLNSVFARLMSRSAVEIDYDASHWLHAGAEFPEATDRSCFAGAPIELHLVPEARELGDDSASEEPESQLERSGREALVVARRIEEMMGEHQCPRMMVAERDGRMRPIKYQDIVILLRATRYHADEYAQVLRTRGIPVYNAGGGGYFDAAEVRDVVSLLRLLDNQLQDVPMAAVLRSPLSGLPKPDDAMARIRLAYNDPRQHVPFHEAVVRYAREKDDELAARLRDFLNDIAEWRRIARQRPVADLIGDIYQRTGFLAFCSGLRNGSQRSANLVQLQERARQFGAFAKQSLYRFIRFLENLREETDAAQATELGEAEDVVRIMSVHKSKGLEFPVVILPELGKRINFQGCSGSIVTDRHACLGMTAVDERKRIRYPSLASTLVSERLRRQTLAEELRVLYVAMTRAREHLILVGTCKADAEERWSRDFDLHEGPLPQNVVLGARTMLDWLGPVSAALSGDGGASIQVYPHPVEEIFQWMRQHHSPQRAVMDERLVRLEGIQDPVPPDAAAEEIIANLTARYPQAALSQTQAAIGVRELAAEDAPLDIGSETLRLPRCLLDQPQISAIDRGEAMHLFLRHVDFTRPCALVDLAEQAAQMETRRCLTASQVQALDLDSIAWFCSTELGRLARTHSHRLLREHPIEFAVEPRLVERAARSHRLDRMMVRGRIDLVIPLPDALVVVDYKTDASDGGEEFHGRQLGLYRDALERISNQKVVRASIVYLTRRRIVSI